MKKTLIAILSVLCSCHILPSKKISVLPFEPTREAPKYRFLYDDTTGNTYLRQLRTENGLESLIKNAQTDQERALILLDWTHRQWSHNGSNQPSKSDPISILKEAKTGKKYRCVEYGIVSMAALQSVGIKARVLGLKTRDIEITKLAAGHVLAEVWLEDLKKWAMVDGQFNTMPLLDGLPLNAVEFQQAIMDKKPFKIVNMHGEISAKERKKYLHFIPHYLYYFDVHFDNRTIYTKQGSLPPSNQTSLMLVPKGAKNPTIFQRKSPMKHLAYTNRLADFYAPPN